MLQGAIRRVLRDISDRHIPPRLFHGVRTGGSSGHYLSPRPESMLQHSPGVCPTHGPAMFVRRMGVPPETLPRPPMTLLPPPPPLSSTALALPWKGGAGSMAVRHGAPPLPNHSAGTEAWPPGFAYDLDVALPPPPPPSGPRSYADVTANHRQGLRQNALPLENALGSAVPGLQRRPLWPELAGDEPGPPCRPVSMAGARASARARQERRNRRHKTAAPLIRWQEAAGSGSGGDRQGGGGGGSLGLGRLGFPNPNRRPLISPRRRVRLAGPIRRPRPRLWPRTRACRPGRLAGRAPGWPTPLAGWAARLAWPLGC
ncbi:unnamed protein product [Miscanthus lutarioriparius]|uniref:Uncharacterized protein n=1 Tax=Miscanthus lutarioriparius TaxID=422564 RepID=A0A811PM71_9POAL|nr:unnamed protein product [Miscanthus lutarioriparius]